MPQVITDRGALLGIVQQLELTSELFSERDGKMLYGPDLEVIVQGRDYGNNKRVGPYFRLLRYQPGEAIMQQGEWGNDTFYVGAIGKLDVWVKDQTGTQRKISELEPGKIFGEMTVLFGLEREATVIVPPGRGATVLEIARPGLRLLRKLPKFGQALDEVYRAHSMGRAFEELGQILGGPLKREILDRLAEKSKFVVYKKSQFLFKEGEQIDRIILIKSGWIRRVRGMVLPADSVISTVVGEKVSADFVGAGGCLGLEGAQGISIWSYTASVMARAEVLELPIHSISKDPLSPQLITALSSLTPTHTSQPPRSEDLPQLSVLSAVEAEIANDVIDGVNLLVMDMDLCIRCGNCSLACHKVHGQSRLVRRGINIKRPVGNKNQKTRNLLFPQVCLHCKNAECLTGCPTGAIFRNQDGFIEINADGCIGSYDCATQCPYNAITMVPRDVVKGDREPLQRSYFRAQLKKLLGRRSGASPPLSFGDSDDPVAVNCNLCKNTGLNPPGTKRQAYSCEENCPTGALVRVDPTKYFNELQGSLGFVFQDKQHAIGRNIHQHDTVGRLWHLGGALLTLIVLIAIGWGLVNHGLNGPIRGTLVTMRWVTGVLGLISVCAVLTYPLRKQVYRRRFGALRYWLLAHIYIGVLGAVTMLMHSGTRTGGPLTTLLYISFAVVIMSGVFGLVSYIVCPRLLTSIEGEPLLIEDLTIRRAELDSELKETCSKSEGWLRAEIHNRIKKHFLSRFFLFQQILRRRELKIILAEARETFKDVLTRTTDNERATLLQALEIAVTLQRVNALIALHRLMRTWIAPHVISTSLMLALMLVHVVDVISAALVSTK